MTFIENHIFFAWRPREFVYFILPCLARAHISPHRAEIWISFVYNYFVFSSRMSTVAGGSGSQGYRGRRKRPMHEERGNSTSWEFSCLQGCYRHPYSRGPTCRRVQIMMVMRVALPLFMRDSPHMEWEYLRESEWILERGMVPCDRHLQTGSTGVHRFSCLRSIWGLYSDWTLTFWPLVYS